MHFSVRRDYLLTVGRNRHGSLEPLDNIIPIGGNWSWLYHADYPSNGLSSSS